MEHLKAADFEKHLNTKFKIHRAEDSVFEAALVEVFELRNDDLLESFSIIFLVPIEFGFFQQIFKFEHDEMGTMELFIVPVRQVETGIRYEAIFNRVVEK
jgi:hypothetical protein